MVESLLKQLFGEAEVPDSVRKKVAQALLQVARAAKKEERIRCYKYALHCRDRFQTLSESSVVAAEVVAEGIRLGDQG